MYWILVNGNAVAVDIWTCSYESYCQDLGGLHKTAQIIDDGCEYNYFILIFCLIIHSFYRNLRGALESKTVAGPEEIKHCHRHHSGRVPETRREEEKERARQHSADEEDIELGDLFLN